MPVVWCQCVLWCGGGVGVSGDCVVYGLPMMELFKTVQAVSEQWVGELSCTLDCRETGHGHHTLMP